MFKNSIKSPYTLEVYSSILDLYKEHCNVTTFTDLLMGEDRKAIETKIIQWIVNLKNPESKHAVKGNSLKTYLAVVKHFYDYNDVVSINWRKMKGFLPDTTAPKADKPYSLEQIRKLLDLADIRMKVAILLQASSGLRVGALIKLKVRDLQKVGHIYMIKVDVGTKEEYTTFCTVETATLIDEYFAYRKRLGEIIQPDHPVIRELNSDPAHPRHITVTTLSNMMTSLAVRAGIRTITKGQSYDRKEVKLNHGLRKFTMQQMRRSKMDNVLIERLLGHQSGNIKEGISKLAMVYDPEDIQELAAEYLKAQDFLTINSEKKLRIEKAEVEKKLQGETVLIDKINQMEAQHKEELQQALDEQEEKLKGEFVDLFKLMWQKMKD